MNEYITTPDPVEQLRQELVRRQDDSGLTDREMAEKMGVSYACWNQVARGARPTARVAEMALHAWEDLRPLAETARTVLLMAPRRQPAAKRRSNA